MDAETIESVRRAIMWAALAGLVALLITLFIAAVLPELRRAWRRTRRASRVVAVLFAAWPRIEGATGLPARVWAITE